jgi:hypothetical protein
MLRSHSGDSITERAVEAYSWIEEPRLCRASIHRGEAH